MRETINFYYKCDIIFTDHIAFQINWDDLFSFTNLIQHGYGCLDCTVSKCRRGYRRNNQKLSGVICGMV